MPVCSSPGKGDYPETPIHKAYIKKQNQSDWVPEDYLVFYQSYNRELIYLYFVYGYYWISLLDIGIFIYISTQNYSGLWQIIIFMPESCPMNWCLNTECANTNIGWTLMGEQKRSPRHLVPQLPINPNQTTCRKYLNTLCNTSVN